jgi:hypothetical protein
MTLQDADVMKETGSPGRSGEDDAGSCQQIPGLENGVLDVVPPAECKFGRQVARSGFRRSRRMTTR